MLTALRVKQFISFFQHIAQINSFYYWAFPYTHESQLAQRLEKYTKGHKSHDLGGQLTGPNREKLFSKFASVLDDCFAYCKACATVLLKPQVKEVQLFRFGTKQSCNHSTGAHIILFNGTGMSLRKNISFIQRLDQFLYIQLSAGNIRYLCSTTSQWVTWKIVIFL